MENKGVNEFLEEQINKCGKDSVLNRYSTMNAVVAQIANELKDSKKASLLTDVSAVLNIIVEHLKAK